MLFVVMPQRSPISISVGKPIVHRFGLSVQPSQWTNRARKTPWRDPPMVGKPQSIDEYQPGRAQAPPPSTNKSPAITPSRIRSNSQQIWMAGCCTPDFGSNLLDLHRFSSGQVGALCGLLFEGHG